MSENLIVSEIFRSIQGEGTRAGRPCTLIRLAGCNLHCRWCDTEYALHEGESMTIETVLAKVAALKGKLVEVTGGEPLIQEGTLELLRRLSKAGYEVLLETSGERDITPVGSPVVRIVDIKCPSSGESQHIRWENLEHLRSTDEVKFVVADRADYDFAADVIARFDLVKHCTVLVGAVAGQLDSGKLAEWILEDGLNVRLQVQLHKILWPNATRGV
jgi:7-carboxy-7-deazaguanine synthase